MYEFTHPPLTARYAVRVRVLIVAPVHRLPKQRLSVPPGYAHVRVWVAEPSLQVVDQVAHALQVLHSASTPVP